jgi:hypothetical protein
MDDNRLLDVLDDIDLRLREIGQRQDRQELDTARLSEACRSADLSILATQRPPVVEIVDFIDDETGEGE